MSYVIAVPDAVAAAATDVASNRLVAQCRACSGGGPDHRGGGRRW